MYFPYLRGKQFELFSLRDLMKNSGISRLVIPIIEPVKRNLRRLKSVVELFTDHNREIILIWNPRVGELTIENENLRSYLLDLDNSSSQNIKIAFLITPNIAFGQVDQFVESISNLKKCFIHHYQRDDFEQLKTKINQSNSEPIHIFDDHAVNQYYKDSGFLGDHVILTDGFRRQRTNSDYPARSFFSSQHKSFRSENFVGFSDYSVIGEEFMRSGGPAYTVAVHLSNIEVDDDIWIRHFLSESDPDSPVDPAGKSNEAISNMLQWVENSGQYYGLETQGLMEYRNLASDPNYHGLGILKQFSIMHHLEIIDNILRQY